MFHLKNKNYFRHNVGKHLMGVEDLLQKHSLVEADINVLGERVKGVVQQSQRFLDQEATEGYRPCDPAMIIERVQQLEVMRLDDITRVWDDSEIKHSRMSIISGRIF
mgnify:CR=1 FL=1